MLRGRALMSGAMLLAGLGVVVPTPRAAAASPPIVLFLMENHSLAQLNATNAPYLFKTFAPAGRAFTQYKAITHPACRTTWTSPRAVTRDVPPMRARLNPSQSITSSIR